MTYPPENFRAVRLQRQLRVEESAKVHRLQEQAAAVSARKALINDSISYSPWLMDQLTEADRTAVVDFLSSRLYGAS